MVFFSRKLRALLAGFFILFGLDANANIQSVQIRGSTTLTPLAQKIAEAYMQEHANVRVAISSGGTERGYKAVVDGTADIAMASGQIPDNIANECELKEIALKKYLVGYATIIAVVHGSNPVANLSMKQLRGIFAGRITNWKTLGGKDAPIKVFVGPPTGGINDTWKSLVLGEADTYTPAGIVLDNKSRLHAIESEPNAITFLTVDSSDYSKLKLLSINHIPPDKEFVQNGSYALRAPLMLVTRANPSVAARQFIEYFIAPERDSQYKNIVKLAMEAKQ